MGIITLLTDFGLKDPYVGIMKGVILGLNPKASLVDLTHQVGPGDIVQGARIIRDSFSFFPPGTIHVAVVDPGVGTNRKPILVKKPKSFFRGSGQRPFLAALSRLIQRFRLIHLTRKEFFMPRISRTFHGRDIFAPVAGHLSLGVEPSKMGEIMEDPMSLPDAAPIQKEGDPLWPGRLD
jgi:S-adenosylmethionine hydrolase